MMNKVLMIKCAQCETKFNYYSSEFRPFCSERCKKIDLGHWFNESYVVPLKEEIQSEQDFNEYSVDQDDESNDNEDQGY